MIFEIGFHFFPDKIASIGLNLDAEPVNEPFRVASLASDISASFNYLASRLADLSITYHPAAEEIAILQGIATKSVYAWRDHWMLVGK